MAILYDVRAIYFPYCIQKEKDGSWVILNRNYKPVGMNTGDFVEYKKHPVSARPRSLTAATLKKLSYKGESESRVYLYNDGTNPLTSKENMDAYLKKLAILMKVKLKV